MYSGTIVIFGAGNIGRSFVGQVFSRSGWEVVFVDVDAALVEAINARRAYDVVIRRDGVPDETIPVRNVRAVNGRDLDAVARELSRASLAATCVGKAALPRILPALAKGIEARGREAPPLDLIIAENDREAPQTIRGGLESLLPEMKDLDERLGLVETSIGKMVPIARRGDAAEDRLRVYAEAYNTLIVDGRGFRGPRPEVLDLKPVDDIRAYVDRKLFVHNLGHATVAYLGFMSDPSLGLISEVIGLPGVREGARIAMTQAAAALSLEYPDAFDAEALGEHIRDLLERFGNSALGDTVYRVGRDLPRKLGRSDRIVGAALLCERHDLPWDGIARAFRSSLEFRAVDEAGAAYPPDEELLRRLASEGLQRLLATVCGLAPTDELDERVTRGLSANA